MSKLTYEEWKKTGSDYKKFILMMRTLEDRLDLWKKDSTYFRKLDLINSFLLSQLEQIMYEDLKSERENLTMSELIEVFYGDDLIIDAEYTVIK